jgi:hypothetical protein
MSRAYRIRQRVRVRAHVDTAVSASDEICTRIDILEVLPPEQMAELLATELEQRGFERQADGTMARESAGVKETVNPHTGEVAVRAEKAERVELTAEREISVEGYDTAALQRQQARERERMHQELERQAPEAAQTKLSRKMEERLCELGRELGDAVHAATAEALKQKAAQMGTVKEIAEDPAAGSLTITVEV